MPSNMDQCSTTTRTFRFGSGEVITLDERQIILIPYLAALLSFTDRFVGARDEEGHLRLDPNIDSKYFSFILQASSFSSLQELLTQLPVEHDVIAMIAHLDFLGLIIEGNPTLDDVDATFFRTLLYDIHDRTYSQRIRPSTIRSMAARFTFALAREEYDFSDDRVMDRIYWYVMFILSASSMFDSRLRHNVRRVAENCFRLFKPSLLELLKKLHVKTGEDTSLTSSLPSGMNIDEHEESGPVLEQLIDTHAQRELSKSYNNRYGFPMSSFLSEQNLDLLLHEYFPPSNKLAEKKLLKIVVSPISQIIYSRLQNAIIRRVKKKFLLLEPVFMAASASLDLLVYPSFFRISQMPTFYDADFLWFYIMESISGEPFKREVLRDLFDNELVQDEIHNLILTAIPLFIQKLERRHCELVKKIQDGANFPMFSFERFSEDSEDLEADTLAIGLLLQKLRQESTTIKVVQELVVERLYETALEQIKSWRTNQIVMWYLREYLSKSSKKTSSSTSSKTCRHHRIRTDKPSPKKQLKHQRR